MNQIPEHEVLEPISEASPQVPLKRHPYFRKEASKESRKLYAVSLALGALCMLLLIISANKFVNGSVFKIPMIATMTDFLGLDLSKDVEDTVEKAQDNVDFVLGILEFFCKDSEVLADLEKELQLPFEEWEAIYGVQPAEFRKLFNPLSLSSLTKLLGYLLGEDHVAVFVLRLLIGLTAGTATVLILLAGLATYAGKSWLSILVGVLCSGFFSLTGGFIYWLLGCGSMVAMGIICFKLTKEYKAYRKSFSHHTQAFDHL